jgi:hexokinase
MCHIKKIVRDFLKKYGLYYGDIDFEQNCQIFIEEMNRGLQGKTSSLEMIPTYIEVGKKIIVDEPVIVLDAGGTYFRSALVSFNKERKAVIDHLKVYPMPGLSGGITREAFFEIMADYIDGIVKLGSRIGFCFSYPFQATSEKDGRLISLSKEIQVEGIEGELIGQNLLAALKLNGHSVDKKIVLINDTVASLLAGTSISSGLLYDSYIGYVLGTGTNSGYLEKNEYITKLKGRDKTKSMVINVESGGYGKAPRGIIDMEFDSKLKDPGNYVFEKMLGGRYLGNLVLMTVQKAGEEAIFSPDFSRKIMKVLNLETKDISSFLNDPLADNNTLSECLWTGNDKDGAVLHLILNMMIERAAVLAAINLSSIIIKINKGIDPCRPVCISAEGSTFYHLTGFQNKLNYYLKKYLTDKKGRYYNFVRVDNATLIGTAIAGLTN